MHKQATVQEHKKSCIVWRKPAGTKFWSLQHVNDCFNQQDTQREKLPRYSNEATVNSRQHYSHTPPVELVSQPCCTDVRKFHCG